MNLFTLLTVIFVVLKLIGQIDWPWLFVVMPSLINVGFVVFFIVLATLIPLLSRRKR